METTQTSEIEKCQDNKHEWEWRDWSTSTYLYGYWRICMRCGVIKYNWPHWSENNYFHESSTTNYTNYTT